MKQIWMTLVVGLILALGSSGLEAQQAPPAKRTTAKKRPRKAKKVWTNDDFPERPAPKAEKAEKAEKKTEPLTEEEKKAAVNEKLEELDARKARAQGDVDLLQERREALLAEIRALEKKLAAKPDQRKQLAINVQVQEKRKQLLMVDDQLGLDRFKVQKVQYEKEELLAPYDTGDYGVPLTAKEKAEQKKQGP